MTATLGDSVNYALPIGVAELPLNELLDQRLKLSFEGVINCVHCDRKTKKSFSQGYCFPCFRRLAACDTCIVSPEKCHFDAGTCREPDWAESNCFVDHVVYLANTSGVKVGITRATQIPTRWIDQGATQAKPIARVSHRHLSGLLETTLAKHVADKTAWQTMLKGDGTPVSLEERRQELMSLCAEEIGALQTRFGLQSLTLLEDADETNISYPVLAYPEKVSAHNFDKNPVVEGRLLGIKGQYLMFDTG
ncbi:MAG: DUF2797 domain-containing protein, partial [Luminiphilus sp.]|nr:DUF2797 domain-containing protein [Luminiphilus sp.]